MPEKKPAAKKTAAKKTTKKKTAAKKTTKLELMGADKLQAKVFTRPNNKQFEDMLDRMTLNVKTTLDKILDRSATRPVRMLSPAMIRRMLMRVEPISLQYAFGSIGWRIPSVNEIIAPASAGKTTFVFHMMSQFIRQGCHCIYIGCEDKMPKLDWLERILHPDRRTATKMLNAIHFAEASSLVECANTMLSSIKEVRKNADDSPHTKGAPIYIFVDPVSGLMSDDEAEGIDGWGLSLKEQAAMSKSTANKHKDKPATFGHSKFFHLMKRRLPKIMKDYFASVFFVSHQKDKIDMTGSTPSYMKPSETKNDTRIGGRALDDISSYRFTLMEMGALKFKSGPRRGHRYGHKTRLTVLKNTDGPRERTADFTIYDDGYHQDTIDRRSPAVDWAPNLAYFFAKEKLLGTTMKDELYSCEKLGVRAVSSEEFCSALYERPDLLEFVGSNLCIEGYSDPITDKDLEIDKVQEDETVDI